MSMPIADASSRPWLVRLSSLVLISLASCANADQNEMFVPNPSLQNDFAENLPTTGSSGGFTYEIVQGHAVLEGDILLGKVDSEGNLGSRFQARGLGKTDAFSRWPDGIIVYERPVNNSATQQINVQLAINHWIEHTTLSFVERTEDNADQYPHYIKFVDSMGCASHVGMIGGPQEVYISDNCRMGNIVHEIGHVAGLFHEHTRPDRDNFVQIAWDDIEAGKDINFSLQTAGVDVYSDYDYGSVMHYGPSSFSSTGNPTIVVSDNIRIGQRDGLSPLDIVSVNKMYETDLALGTPTFNTTDNEDLEIELTVYNQGELGAHELQLVLQLTEDSQWLGVSRDSGWECVSIGQELNCTRDTMRGQYESRFTVLASPGGAVADDLSMILVSRTQDSNPANNSLNGEGVVWESLNDELQVNSVEQAPAIEPMQPVLEPSEDTSTPRLLAANEDNQISPQISGLSSAQSSAQSTGDEFEPVQAAAGSMPLSVMALLLTMIGLRRQSRRSPENR